jgi:hypothetical protein
VISEPIAFDTTVLCPTQTPSSTPLPTRSRFEFVPIEVTALASGYPQLSAFYWGNLFAPASDGYTMQVRVDDYWWSLYVDRFPQTVDGILVTHNSTLFDEATTIESYTMTNTMYQAKATVGFSLSGYLDAAEMWIESLPLLTGVLFSSPGCALAFFVRHHGLGSNFDSIFVCCPSRFSCLECPDADSHVDCP